MAAIPASRLRGAVLFALLASGWPDAAQARSFDLVSNEGQRSDQAADRVYLLRNDRPPSPPSQEPPLDAAGRSWADPGYVEVNAGSSFWRDAVPAWRTADWPRSGLPVDSNGEQSADWIWSSAFTDEFLPALLVPDADNGSRFPRRFSAAGVDGTTSYAHGIIAALQDGALFSRRTFCLPRNLVSAPVAGVTLLAEAQARVLLNGSVAGDTCTGAPATCAAGPRSYAQPSTFALSPTPGRNVLALSAWSWAGGATVGGVLYAASVQYAVSDLDWSLASARLPAGGDLTLEVRAGASGVHPAGAVAVARWAGSGATVEVPSIAAGATTLVTLSSAAIPPGARVDSLVDGLDCAERAAGGPVNLLGGTARAGEGVYSALGLFEESDEANNAASVRAPPALDGAGEDIAVANAAHTLRGQSASGTRVRIESAAQVVAEVEADGDGRFEAPVTLAAGANIYVATASADGLTSAPSQPLTITLDPDAPPAPRIVTPADGSTLETNDFQVTGADGRAGARLLVTLDGAPLCETTPAADGSWSCPSSTAEEGPHRVEARQRSRAGLTGEEALSQFTIARPDAGTVDAGEGPAVDAGDERTPRYALGGGGGCSMGGPPLAALLVLVLLALRRSRHVVAVLLLVAPAARAQMADTALFPGPTPRVPGVVSLPPLSPAIALGLDYARDPYVLLDADTGARSASVVRDQVGMRLVLSLALSERFAFALSAPVSPLLSSPTPIPASLLAWGDAQPASGLGDISAAMLVPLVRLTDGGLALELKATFPTGHSLPLGAGGATAAAGVIASGRLGADLGLELLARTAAVGGSPTLAGRLGASVPAVVSPFVELGGTLSLDNPAAGALAVLDAGLRWKVTDRLRLSMAGGRGLTRAPESPAFRATFSVEFVPPPEAVATPRIDAEHALVLALPSVAPPTLLSPDEGASIPVTTVEISGYAEPLAKVTLYVDGRALPEVAAEADGTFTTSVPDLVAGPHELFAVQQVAAGTSARSEARGFVVEPLVPPVEQNDKRAELIAEIIRVVRENTTLVVRETPEGVSVGTNVRFDFDKSEIRPTDAAKLRELAIVIRAFPQLKIRIDSHTDNIGTPAYNLGLSQRRAESGRRFLVEQEKVDPSRITSVGYGDTRPIASNSTPRGRARNRRFAECMFLVP
jgi:outer membrane protein OmpA-like peptidoglycan-associated protein